MHHTPAAIYQHLTHQHSYITIPDVHRPPSQSAAAPFARTRVPLLTIQVDSLYESSADGVLPQAKRSFSKRKLGFTSFGFV